MNMDRPLLEIVQVSKYFPGVKALDKVGFSVQKGEIHGLAGENGAGKSTLIKILAGVYPKDSGQIFFHGTPVDFRKPFQALSQGISVIYQELNLVPQLDVISNIFLGREYYGFLRRLDNLKMLQEYETICDSVGFHFPPHRLVRDLSIAEQQMVEILKAISFNAELIIMDEPTSSLTERETGQLYKVIKKLKAQGKTIIFISHFIDELIELSDRITVLRDGRYVGTVDSRKTSKQEIIGMMVGREINDIFEYSERPRGEVFLSVKNLSKQGLFRDISFEVRKGEVLGLAGLVGAGRTEVAKAIFGLHHYDAGEITVGGKRLVPGKAGQAIKAGIGLLPEDRKRYGLVMGLSLAKNLTLANLRAVSPLGVIQAKKERDAALQMMKALSIKTPGLHQIVRYLSGGNQQKVVFGKWLLKDCELLILDEPTRGIDVGAKLEVYRLIDELARSGKAIILISCELPEILGLSDRILVMNQGRITAQFSRAEASQEKIMAAALSVV